MKHVKLYEEYLALNEILRVDKEKLDRFEDLLDAKIKNKELLKKIKTTIAVQEIDPYANYRDAIEIIFGMYGEEREMKDPEIQKVLKRAQIS